MPVWDVFGSLKVTGYQHFQIFPDTSIFLHPRWSDFLMPLDISALGHSRYFKPLLANSLVIVTFLYPLVVTLKYLKAIVNIIAVCSCVSLHAVSYLVLSNALEYSQPLRSFKFFSIVHLPILTTTQYWSISALVHLLESVSSCCVCILLIY